MLTLAIIITGASGIIAQTILLRELLIAYLGNELTLGIILAAWLASEALGVFIAGKVIDRPLNKTGVFAALQIIFSLAFPACIYLARTFKAIAGITSGEAISLPLIFYSSFLICLIPAFCHAGLFSCGCKILSLKRGNGQQANPIARIYALEIFGTLVGGFTLTYILLSRFDPFQIAFSVALASLLINLPFLEIPQAKILKYFNLSLIGVFTYLLISGSSGGIQNASAQKQFATGKVKDYQNSPYGNIAVIEKEGQHTFFYNGLPIIISPDPDIAFFEEFGNFPLLFHPAPKNILILGAGAGGLINEVLKYPAETIDYIELDPLVIALLKKYPTAMTKNELGDRRVSILNTDGRLFLRNAKKIYDIIFVGLPNPRDLSTNRFFTADFFSLTAKKISGSGIVAFCLPGSLTYLSAELKDLNACILNALKQSFPYIRVIPGDHNIFLASNSPEIMGLTAAQLSGRIDSRKIETNLLIPGYLEYRMDSRWTRWFNLSMAGATTKINQDTRPFAVFTALVLWNKQFSNAGAKTLNYLSGMNTRPILITILIITGAVFMITAFRRGKGVAMNLGYAIATTGTFGMLISLVIIFIFQIHYGSIYREIGVITSLFLAGSAIGSILALRLLRDKEAAPAMRLFIKTEIAVIAFALATALFSGFLRHCQFAYPMLLTLALAAGFFPGFEFPIAGKIFTSRGKQVGETSGTLYFADLIGGCIAGILGGVFLLPVIGIGAACLVLALLKLSSLGVLIFTKILQKYFDK